MKKQLLLALLATMPAALLAQSAVDVKSLSPSQLRGTARFMSMGGAFTALGGDLSTLSQNPAGMGIYRSSEIGATLDIDMQSSKTNSDGFGLSNNQTKVACNNFGYVGAVNTGSDVMPYFSWGVNYGRVASFDRVYRGGGMLGGSLSNYIANFTNGTDQSDLVFSQNRNPYYDSSSDWLSILAYNAYMVNPVGNNSTYQGLWDGSSSGDAMFTTRESGYVDEYNIDFGGNIMNTLYWGLGFGITDISYRQESYYDELIDNAQVENSSNSALTRGTAEYALSNWKRTTGNGFNFKVGLIFKPINELRFGIAVHTPTYYSLQSSYNGIIDYEYKNAAGQIQHSSYKSGTDYSSETPYAYYDWSMHTPWKLMVGAAGVIGSSAIVSLDYERQAYNDMSAKDGDGYSLDYVNTDIKDTYQATNIIRLGLELRPTSSFSLRCGFNYETTDATDGAYNASQPVYTAGTNPAYTLTDNTYRITAGMGYRYHGFYADLAYVYSNRKSKWNGFSSVQADSGTGNYSFTGAPTADLTDTNNHIVLSLGFKF